MSTDDNDKTDKTDEAEKKDAAEAADGTDPEATSIGERERGDEEPKAEEPKAEEPAAAAGEADAAKHDHDEAPGIAEPDRINVGMILAITVGIVVITVAVVIGVREFFSQTIAGEVSKKLLEPEDPLKKELHVVEQAKLSKYQYVNQKDGIVRIPLARAKELVLADYGNMSVYQPGQINPPAPPPEPTPAPAPDTSASAAASGSASAAPSVSASAAPSVAPPGAASGSAAPPPASASAPHHH